MNRYLDSECAKLDIAMLRRAGAFDLEPGEVKDGRIRLDPDHACGGAVVWGVEADDDGKPTAIALLHRFPGGEPLEQAVMLTTTPCRYGNVRHWFVCPVEGCQRRVRVLYLTPSGSQYVCRHCAAVVYASTRESHSQRLARREAKLQGRLGGEDPLGGGKPRGMHRKTFDKVSTVLAAMKLDRHEEVLDRFLREEGLGDLVSDSGSVEDAVRQTVGRKRG